MDPNRLLTKTLHTAPWGGQVIRILAAALDAVDPMIAVKGALNRQADKIIVGEHQYDLNNFNRLFLVGAGKAGAPMAAASAEILGPHLTQGVLVVKEGYAELDVSPHEMMLVRIVEAGHPLPDQRGVDGTRQMIDLLAQTCAEDLVVCLISGGGSALLTQPVAGVTLEDLRALTDLLLASGATINEINTLRKHLDQVKGGGLARLAAPAQVVTLILSDVVGNPLDIIASGPTVPDPGTFTDALAVLQRHEILDRVPRGVRAHIERGSHGEIPETPKPGDPLFDRVQNVLVGSNQQAAEASLSQAQTEGFTSLLLTTFLEGEARQAGRFLAALIRQMVFDGQPVARPACVILGGETTVTLRGDGLGGRNQELALGAVGDLSGLDDVALVTLATDGGDGPTDAAGAVVTGETLNLARQAGLTPDDFLARNDSYHFFAPLGDLLRPGPTQTNVNDLAFLFAF